MTNRDIISLGNPFFKEKGKVINQRVLAGGTRSSDRIYYLPEWNYEWQCENHR
jgi:hypothetical protein